jgi:hypothetical protein
MQLLLPLALLAATAAATPIFAQSRGCPAAGMKIHWIADYCMSKLETDDEIVAGSCINIELERAFKSECVAKVHYKRALCRLAVARKQTPNDMKSCIADKTFMGPTVRNGGVGGR